MRRFASFLAILVATALVALAAFVVVAGSESLGIHRIETMTLAVAAGCGLLGMVLNIVVSFICGLFLSHYGRLLWAILVVMEVAAGVVLTLMMHGLSATIPWTAGLWVTAGCVLSAVIGALFAVDS